MKFMNVYKQNFTWESIPQNQKITLFTTGCYRLPHPYHVLLMVELRKKLLNGGHKNISIIFSPSHDSWIQDKCKKKGGIH